MPINTRTKKREMVNALAEYAVSDANEKSVQFNMSSLAKAKQSDSGFIKSSLLDISVIGCAMDSQFLMPPGIVLDVRFDPTPFTQETGRKHDGPICVTGSVTSCRMMEKGRYRLGVKFLKLEKEDKDLIEYFISLKERRQAQRWDMTK